MKKILLTMVALMATMFVASAQTNLVENGDFEAWTEGAPVNWKSTTSASNATLVLSNEAHSGNSSVLVQGGFNAENPSKSSNKRLAYQEITLQAGAYKVQFYAKAATEEGGTVRAGYAIVEGGSIAGGNAYKYGDYVNDLTTADWTQVVYDFTLDAETTVNMIVMNGKKPGKDVLIDDYSLVAVEGGGEITPDPQPQPQPGNDVIFEEAFADSVHSFTIDNKVMPADANFIWTFNTKGKAYMKASAYYSKSGHDAESWLVSPVIDLTQVKEAELSFDQAANFFEGFDGRAVMVKAEGGEWAKAEINNDITKDSWTFVTSTVSLNAYAGKKVQFAFVYKGSVAKCGTWEVNNVKVAAAKGGDVKPEPQPEPQPEGNVLFEEAFADSVHDFAIEDKVMPEGANFIWKFSEYQGKAYMKASAYINKQGHDAESWLVSPVIDLTSAKDAVLSFDQAANFFKGFDGRAVMVKVEGGEWVKALIEGDVTSDSWKFVTSTVDLNAYVGKKVQIAFVYTSSVEKCGTWEVNNVKVLSAGEGGVDPEPQPEPQPEDNVLFEEAFADSVHDFAIEDKVMPEGANFIWKFSEYQGKAYMKASAFFNNQGHDAESWLVSPVIDLTKAKDVVLSFDQAANFFKGFDGRAVMVKVEGGEWVKALIEGDVTSDSWKFVTSTVDLNAYVGKKVQIAFVYTSSVEKCGTWEVNNVKVTASVATGIEAVETENQTQVIYDLSGRRVEKAVKGLYIINGKKVYVK